MKWLYESQPGCVKTNYYNLLLDKLVLDVAEHKLNMGYI